MIDILIQNIHQLNLTMQNFHQLNKQNIDQLRDEFNETMQIMQTNMDNSIASNDFELKAINNTLQYVVKIPMVIVVPSSDEIDHHRSKIIKIQRTRSYFTLRPN